MLHLLLFVTIHCQEGFGPPGYSAEPLFVHNVDDDIMLIGTNKQGIPILDALVKKKMHSRGWEINYKTFRRLLQWCYFKGSSCLR